METTTKKTQDNPETLPVQEDKSRLIPISMEELAQMFAIERPSLSRVFSQLEEQNVIKRENKNDFDKT